MPIGTTRRPKRYRLSRRGLSSGRRGGGAFRNANVLALPSVASLSAQQALNEKQAAAPQPQPTSGTTALTGGERVLSGQEYQLAQQAQQPGTQAVPTLPQSPVAPGGIGSIPGQPNQALIPVPPFPGAVYTGGNGIYTFWEDPTTKAIRTYVGGQEFTSGAPPTYQPGSGVTSPTAAPAAPAAPAPSGGTGSSGFQTTDRGLLPQGAVTTPGAPPGGEFVGSSADGTGIYKMPDGTYRHVKGGVGGYTPTPAAPAAPTTNTQFDPRTGMPAGTTTGPQGAPSIGASPGPVGKPAAAPTQLTPIDLAQFGGSAPPWLAAALRGEQVTAQGKAYANGGMVDEPMIGWGMRTGTPMMIGEMGPEMVMPMRPVGQAPIARQMSKKK